MGEKERERERENGEIKGKPKKLKEKTQEAVCLETAIIFLYRFTLPQISSLKYAPVTSCDVQEPFSMLKNVQSDKRMSLNEDNLEKFVVS